jgi:hypothetical protein
VLGTVSAQRDILDLPLDKKVFDLGPSPFNLPGATRVRIELSCYYYTNFAIKQFDEGQKGADWLAIVPIKAGRKPECSQVRDRAERRIDQREWVGYFMGAQGNLVFLSAADGENGGIPFVIYDSRSGTKFFEDSSYDANTRNKRAGGSSPFDHLRVVRARNGKVTLVYLRVVATKCDLHRDAASCWEQVRRKLDIKRTAAPVCSDYADIKDFWTSAVAFPVEVSLYSQPKLKTVDGPVKCWPVD